MTVAGPPLTGLLLAGGQARRLGGDKAGAEVGGRTLLERVADVAAVHCDQVLLLAADRDLSLGTMTCVPDLPGVAGPLGGLGAGLAAARHPWCLLLACDQPFVSAEVVGALVQRAATAEPTAVAVVLRDADGLQPFCGLYHRRLLPVLRRRVAAGERSLRGLLAACAPLCVGVDELPAELVAASLFDVDTPDDLARARQLCPS